jgi:hypothetical protein
MIGLEVIEKCGGYTPIIKSLMKQFTVAGCENLNKVTLVNFEIGYFCIQWRSFFKARITPFFKQHSIYLELMMIYLGGNFLFVRCL